MSKTNNIIVRIGLVFFFIGLLGFCLNNSIEAVGRSKYMEIGDEYLQKATEIKARGMRGGRQAYATVALAAYTAAIAEKSE